MFGISSKGFEERKRIFLNFNYWQRQIIRVFILNRQQKKE